MARRQRSVLQEAKRFVIDLSPQGFQQVRISSAMLNSIVAMKKVKAECKAVSSGGAA
jgi:hypothetical protein